MTVAGRAVLILTALALPSVASAVDKTEPPPYLLAIEDHGGIVVTHAFPRQQTVLERAFTKAERAGWKMLVRTFPLEALADQYGESDIDDGPRLDLWFHLPGKAAKHVVVGTTSQKDLCRLLGQMNKSLQKTKYELFGCVERKKTWGERVVDSLQE